MSRLLKIISLLLLAVWLPATLHCSLEAVGFELECHDAPADVDAHGCQADACDVVEGGSYAKSIAGLRVLPPAFTEDIGALILTMLRPVEIAEPEVRRVDSPEITGLSRTWSFDRRAALPARAPARAV